MSARRPIGGGGACTEPLWVEALEPRVLYSADILTAFLSATADPVDDVSPIVVPAGPDPVSGSDTVASPLSVVDSRVPDPTTLIDALRSAGHDVLFVEVDHDAIEQISEALALEGQRSAVHVFAHGDGDGMRLGDQLIDASALVQRASEIGAWSASLEDDADILLWACELGSTPAGLSLVDTLAQLTGADVAASDDVTGHAGLGGNWELETRVGRIDAPSLAVSAELSSWQGALRIISVTTTEDGLRNDGFDFTQIDNGASNITLREAIHAINKNGDDEDDTEAHVIELAAGTYRLTLDGTEDRNRGGDLDIESSMTIRGVSASDTTLIQQRTERLLDVQGDDVVLTVESLTLQGGESPSGTNGGAVLGGDESSIVVKHVHLLDNHADDEGGAIYSKGSLRIEDSVFKNNVSERSGGAIHAHGDLEVERSTFERNESLGDKGGAIRAQEWSATVRFTDTQFTANTASDDGGAIYLQNDGAVLSRVTFDANEAEDGGALAIRQAGVTVSNATFLGNIARDDGGAIHADRSFTVSASTFVDNRASGGGGAIRLDDAAVVTAHSSLFVGNAIPGHPSAGNDIQGGVESLGYNLFDSLGGMVFTNAGGAALPTDIVSTEPAREVVANTLTNDGGHVSTLALPEYSIAIDAGGSPHPAIANDPDVDANQRTRDEIRDVGASESVSPGEVLFYADDTGRIWRSTPELTYSQLIVDTGRTGVNAPRDLEVDIAAGYLFWFSDNGTQLWRSGLDDVDAPKLLGTRPAGVATIALDAMARRLYVLRVGTTAGIDVHDYDGAFLGMVPGGDFGIDSPGDLAFDQRHERLIWTQKGGADPGLYTVGIDGTGYRQITTFAPLTEPDGLAFDSAGHTAYLVDSASDLIIAKAIDRDGTRAAPRTGDTVAHGYLSDSLVVADVDGQSVLRLQETLELISGPESVPNPILSVTIGATSGTDAAPTVSGSLNLVVERGASVILGNDVLDTTDDRASSAQLTWTVTDLPDRGDLYVYGKKWSDNLAEARYFTQEEIASGVVQYRNTSPLGIVDDEIVLQVDDGRTAPVPVTIAIDVRGTNNPPTLSTQTVDLSQGQASLLTSAMLSISDPDGIDPDTRLRVDTGATGITLHDTTLDARTADVSWQQLIDGEIEVRADDREVGPIPLSFDFDVEAEDSAGGSDVQSWTVTFGNRNDAPALTTQAVDIDEAGSLSLSPTVLDLTDSDGINGATRFDIDTGESTTGLSLYAGDSSTKVSSFTWKQLQDGVIELRADGREPSGSAHTLSVSVDDTEGGTVTVDWSVTVTPTNDPLQLSTAAVALLERGFIVLDATTLQLSDNDGVDTASVYTWDPLQAGLSIVRQSDGSALASFTQQQLIDGEVALAFDDTEPRSGAYAIAMRVQASDGETATAALSATVANVNDAPQLIATAVTVGEGGVRGLTVADLALADDDGIVASTRFDIDTDEAATGLSLYASDSSTKVSRFTWQQLQDGVIELRADGREPSGSAHTLSVSVDDTEGGTVTVDWSVTVTPTNDPLQLSTAAVTLLERGSTPLDASVLTLSDNDGVDTASMYTWDPLQAGLSIVRQSDGSALVSFTQQQLIDGEVALAFDDAEPRSGAYAIALQVQASDGETASAVLPVAVENVNDAPVLVASPVTVGEGGVRPLTVADLALADDDGIVAGTRFDIDTDEAATGLSLVTRDTDEAVSGFTWRQLEDGLIELRADGREPSAAPHRLIVTVDDTRGASAASEWRVTVGAVNDAPISTAPDGALGLAGRDVWQLPDGLFTDVDSAVLSYSATTLDGAALPDWLTFDAQARRFDATQVPVGQANVNVRLSAVDDQGAEASMVVSLIVQPPELQAANPDPVVPIDGPVFAPTIVSPVPRPVEAQAAGDRTPEAAPEATPSAALGTTAAVGDTVADENGFAATTTELRALIDSLPRVSTPASEEAVVERSVAIRSLVAREVQQDLDTLDLVTLFAQLASDARETDPQLLDALQNEKERLEERAAFAQTAVGGSMAVSSGLSIGYLIWLIRGGTLAGSVLSSLPAWRFVDPLPVLSSLGGDGQPTDTESLQSLVETDDRVSRR